MQLHDLLYMLLATYEWAVILRVLSTWIPDGEEYLIVRLLASLSDPYLRLFQGWIPLIGGTLDISPILALLVLNWVKNAATIL